MRALVIDDQRDFFESIVPILRKAGFISEYAPDLSSARRSLTERCFDVVLTDLQMPPGNWGGFDAIKMVRELDKVVPLFVVSGKGSLAECIQAVRLGADDYVRKEVFAEEFFERARPRFAHPYAIEYFPSLLAYLYRLFEEEQQEYAKARRLIDVYENCMRLLSLMIMAEEHSKTGTSIVSLLEGWDMTLPSLGRYVSFVFDSMQGTWDGKLLGALRISDLGRLRGECDRLTNCRNQDFGHSIVISTQRSEEIVETFWKVLVRLLNAVSCLRRFRLFVANALRYDGMAFTANGRWLCGSNLHPAAATIVLKSAVPTEHAVIILDTEVIANLTPLVEVVTAQEGNWIAYRIYSKLGRKGIEFDLVPK